MASKIIRLFPPTVFKFTDIAYSAGSPKALTFDIAQRIDTADYCQGKLIVRTYDNQIQHDQDYIQVYLYEDPYTPDAPGQDWPIAGEYTQQIASVSVSGGNPPLVEWDYISSGLGAIAKVAIIGRRDTSSNATNTIEARLDAALVLKSC